MWAGLLLGVVVVLALAWALARRRYGTPAEMGPAGWYADPAGSGRRRWFDGHGWTDRYEDPTVPPARHRAA